VFLSSLISSFKKQHFAIFRIWHIDKINYDDSAHITKTYCLAISAAAIILTSMAVSSWLVALLERFPLFTSITCKASVFDNKIRPFTHGYCFSKRSFDFSLCCISQNRCVFWLIKLNNWLFGWCNFLQVILCLVVQLFVIYLNTAEGIVENVS
jgi:hypothetical protein